MPIRFVIDGRSIESTAPYNTINDAWTCDIVLPECVDKPT